MTIQHNGLKGIENGINNHMVGSQASGELADSELAAVSGGLWQFALGVVVGGAVAIGTMIANGPSEVPAGSWQTLYDTLK